MPLVRPAGKQKSQISVYQSALLPFLFFCNSCVNKAPTKPKVTYNQARPAGPVHRAEVKLGVDILTQAGWPLVRVTPAPGRRMPSMVTRDLSALDEASARQGEALHPIEALLVGPRVLLQDPPASGEEEKLPHENQTQVCPGLWGHTCF